MGGRVRERRGWGQGEEGLGSRRGGVGVRKRTLPEVEESLSAVSLGGRPAFSMLFLEQDLFYLRLSSRHSTVITYHNK